MVCGCCGRFSALLNEHVAFKTSIGKLSTAFPFDPCLTLLTEVHCWGHDGCNTVPDAALGLLIAA